MFNFWAAGKLTHRVTGLRVGEKKRSLNITLDC
jgi:hypothetical protein